MQLLECSMACFVTVGGSILASRGLSTLDISFFFLFISILPLGPLVLRNRLILSEFRSNWKYLSLYSLVNSCLYFRNLAAFRSGLSPPRVAFLLYTQPVWTVVFGRAFFGERMSRARICIILLALSGSVLVTDPASIIGSHNLQSGLGEVIAASGGVFLSLWIILGKKGRLRNIENPLELTFAVRASSSLPVGVISIGSLLLGRGLFLSNIPAEPLYFSLIIWFSRILRFEHETESIR
ncbi:MAG: DMT family transporter [Thaumarchaeota archaeon]|nr:DMT family transporter [Nitrososphaerota archaeon]